MAQAIHAVSQFREMLDEWRVETGQLAGTIDYDIHKIPRVNAYDVAMAALTTLMIWSFRRRGLWLDYMQAQDNLDVSLDGPNALFPLDISEHADGERRGPVSI